MDSGTTSGLLGLGVLAAALIACATTNPTKQEHLDAISDKNGLVGGIAQVASLWEESNTTTISCAQPSRQTPTP